MFKKFLLVLLILLTAILGGCFGKKNSDDSGKGVNLIREENRVRVFAEDEIAGGSFIIDRELEPDNILVEADKMKIWIVNTFLYNFYSVIFVRRYSTGVMYSKVL